MGTQSTHSWSQLKAHLKELEKENLLSVIRDLYGLNPDNQRFLSACFLAATPDEMAEPYRQIISQVFNPRHGAASLDLRAARKALSTFKRVGAGEVAEIDLMLFYVEQAVACASDNRAINESVYSSMRSVYEEAVTAILALDDPALTAAMRPRFAAIIKHISDLDWGLYEYLMDLYVNTLELFDDE